jgi:hypothetical protein
MRRFFFGMALLAMSSVPVMTVHADEAADQKIAEQIVERLQTEKQAGRLKGFSIDLQVEEGTVYLSGRVANAGQQQAALALARQTPGVRQVVNDLVVPGDEAVDTNVVPVSDESTENSYEAESAPEMTQVELSSPRGVKAKPVSNPTPAPNHLATPAAQAHPLQQFAAPQQQYAGQQYAGPQGAPQGGAPMGGPVPYARATRASHNGPMEGGYAGPGPVAMPQQGYYGGPPVRYDSPQMPGYSWPSYAAYPNYAGVTYPKQYSASAWPYIGPFYPYPQVPLGWRRVSLEWKDGWWFLDFKDRYRHR